MTSSELGILIVKKNKKDMKTIKKLETSEIKIFKENDLEVWEIPASANTKYLSHSYFRYIGQFPPQIARALISQYGKEGGKLLDPMCGRPLVVCIQCCCCCCCCYSSLVRVVPLCLLKAQCVGRSHQAWGWGGVRVLST